ncbi:energy transducer TonB [Komagataeibacter rhaeticus]|uniref:energy transducer TonB n=1 Tax=Komagataeibacter rhaeticus TaxID=215221 RepID=UPI00311997B4
MQQQDRTAGRILVTSTGPAGWRRGRLLAGWAIMAAVLGHGLIAAWLLPARAPVPAAPAEKNSIQVFFDQPGVAPPPQEATPQPQPQPQPQPKVRQQDEIRRPVVRPAPTAAPPVPAHAVSGHSSAGAVATPGGQQAGSASHPAIAPQNGATAGTTASSSTAPHCTQPSWRYPAMARHMHEEGSAVVDLTLGEQGQVLQTTLKTGTGYDDLDSTALAAATKVQCSATGTNLNGRHVLLPVTFHLH